MQAAIGVAQLDKLERFGAARRDNWAFYREALRELEDVFVLPEPTEGSDPSWFGFLLTVRPDAPFTRDAIVQQLESRKIQTRMLFAGNLVRQPGVARWGAERRTVDGKPPFRIVGELTNTDAIMNRSFWIGVYPGLTGPMREYVAEAIVAFARKGAF
jgi:CDP-6-deoxy-D-xylo-4-hexulose-3-dehydrase